MQILKNHKKRVLFLNFFSQIKKKLNIVLHTKKHLNYTLLREFSYCSLFLQVFYNFVSKKKLNCSHCFFNNFLPSNWNKLSFHIFNLFKALQRIISKNFFLTKKIIWTFPLNTIFPALRPFCTATTTEKFLKHFSFQLTRNSNKK